MAYTKEGSGHWYHRDGTPCHWVPKKDGTGNRNTTLADARKLDLLPSVTGILNVLAKPGLQDWITRQNVLAVVTAPDVPGEALDAKITRVLETERQQDEESAAARDRGTVIHSGLELLAQGKTIADLNAACLTMGEELLGPWIEPAWKGMVPDVGLVEASEVVLVGEGYAGRCDLVLRSKGSVYQCDYVVDFKSARTLPKKGSWNEHRLQLAAYAASWEAKNPQTLIKTANLYISTTEQGKFAWFENPAWWVDFQAFKAVLEIWRWQNDYRP
jgi:hypothetical protein